MLRLSLIDYLAARFHCAYISDLRYLSDFEKVILAHEVECISPDECTLYEWNDALAYIVNQPPSDAPANAKEALLANLRNPNFKKVI